jgi:hypothetical protein
MRANLPLDHVMFAGAENTRICAILLAALLSVSPNRHCPDSETQNVDLSFAKYDASNKDVRI